MVGYEAEPATMATLRWSGDGKFMSWSWEKLGEPFEDGAARFAAESRIVSPPRSARKESSSRTFDGEMPKCRATRAFTWFSNMLLIYRELYRARVKGMSIEAKDHFRRVC